METSQWVPVLQPIVPFGATHKTLQAELVRPSASGDWVEMGAQTLNPALIQKSVYSGASHPKICFPTWRPRDL